MENYDEAIKSTAESKKCEQDIEFDEVPVGQENQQSYSEEAQIDYDALSYNIVDEPEYDQEEMK